MSERTNARDDPGRRYVRCVRLMAQGLLKDETGVERWRFYRDMLGVIRDWYQAGIPLTVIYRGQQRARGHAVCAEIVGPLHQLTSSVSPGWSRRFSADGSPEMSRL